MRKHLWLSASALVIYSGLILCLSSIPTSEVPSALFPFDKLIHFSMYSVLGLILAYFFDNLKVNLAQIAVAVAAFFFIAVYGLTDEIHQTLTPGRSFDTLDIFMDVLGGITGWLAFWLFLVGRNSR